MPRLLARKPADDLPQVEFWLCGEDVYRVSGSFAGFDVWGLPLGRRWECALSHWLRCRDSYDWAPDVAA